MSIDKNSNSSEKRRDGIPLVDLADYSPIIAIQGFPKKIVLEYGILPIRKEQDGVLLIAFPSSADLHLLDEVRFACPVPFRPVFAQDDSIDEKLRRLYGGNEAARSAGDLTRTVGALSELGAESTGSDAVAVFKKTLEEAVRARASDIHFEPFTDRLRVRFRIDGVLHEVNSLPPTLIGAMISHIKVAAGLDITEKRLPQDGRIEFQSNIDLRVSCLPTNHGESCVLRILERGIASYEINDLGLSPDHRKLIDEILEVQDGFIVVTGPTGSGKTTSLYAFLREIANPSLKIITVEDPVEYITEGFTQIPVDAEHGTDFGTALRSILRHDPDIVLLGEIRDQESARIALQSALTGHQVFSTLHTNDSPSAVGRLVNLGVEPYLVNAALTAVIAQRLVRKICQHCRAPYPISDKEKKWIERAGVTPPDQLFKGKGCPQCYSTGYRGRIGVFEIITMTPEIQALIASNSPAGKIRDAARAAGMIGMKTDGMLKVCRGETTTDEVVRVLY